MIRAWENPSTGPAAAFAASLRAALPKLRTDRCILRAPVLEDAPFWIAIMVPDTEGHLGGPHTEDEAYTEFAATCGLWLLRGHGLWTVTDHAGQVLGFVPLGFEPGDQAPELGWMFLPEARGKGYALEAATAARAHALDTLALPELVSYIDPTNAPSIRVAERLGAVRAGDFDGAQVWAHRAVAQHRVSTRVETDGRRGQDTMKTME
ncbi:GNAT family N-acetyltransferase [Tabrizicola sp.]|uniref:GNAT family N-acetyltransferase n=1 Tax=Tabrizicola sp. TaxID=2005166 RepID=UPI0026320B75|nr:GNAT family N-acetyltransferase [Tabrizicola sp.]MDM7932651.1 GNAT family N-acetyltransferase [Tabrizicola sp.]